MEKYGCIYKITNSINNKVYIGKTTQKIHNRLSQHIQGAFSGKHNTKFYNSIAKHGGDKFKIDILDYYDDNDSLNKAEINEIAHYDSFEKGYNSTLGGDGGYNSKSVEKCSIPVVCLNTGRKYKNCREAGSDLNISFKLINQVCRGNKRKAKGYVFDYDTVRIDDILDFQAKRGGIQKQNKNNKIYDMNSNLLYCGFTEAAQKTTLSDGTIRNHCYGLVKNPRFRFNNITKSLIIGDWHCKINNLKESQNLMDFIIETSQKEQVDSIIFMGDQLDTHAIIRVEVLHFWDKNLKILNLICPTYLLIGNHDMKGDNQTTALDMNSMSVFKQSNVLYENIHIIDTPSELEGILLMPYFKKESDFLTSAQEFYQSGCEKIMLAHQTFTGATYENGFYAEDGIDPALVPQEVIVSGHIHKQQKIGKCSYVGTPKWDSISDANEDKGIWIYEWNCDKSIKDSKFISTAGVVTPIYKHTVNEGDEEPELIKEARNYIEFIGKSAWITKMKKKYKNKAQIKARPTDRKHVSIVREGLLNINLYLKEHFEVIDGVEKDDIKVYLEKLNEPTT